MRTNELRIGNELFNGRVVSLDKNDIKVNDGYRNWKQSEMLEKFEPIPLTEEWLIKFGFEIPAHSFICDRFHITKQDHSDLWFTAFNKNNAYINTIKYVHQLQNLYFALTGKELSYENNN